LIYNTSQYKAQEMPRLRKKEHTHHHSFIQSEQNHSIWIGIKSTINNVHHSFNQQSTKAYRSPARFREGESFDSSRRVSERERRVTWSDHTRARERKNLRRCRWDTRGREKTSPTVRDGCVVVLRNFASQGFILLKLI
jgi:hypothetical protein